jgi:hypothetical protein
MDSCTFTPQGQTRAVPKTMVSNSCMETSLFASLAMAGGVVPILVFRSTCRSAHALK